MNIQRCPLSWPTGWARKKGYERKQARFHGTERVYSGNHSYARKKDLTVNGAISRLMPELRRLGVQDGDAVISTNVKTRLDGLPYSNHAEPSDPGVAVYFRRKGKDIVLACDTWDRVADNIAAVAGHIVALRAIERYGVGSLDQAFAGYAALPARGETWRSTLGFGPDETVDEATIMERFRAKAREAHPDAGGSHEAMAALTEAKADALRSLK